MPELPKTPTLEQLTAQQPGYHAIRGFLGWLDEQGIHLCKYRHRGDDDDFGTISQYLTHKEPDELLVLRFFDLDHKRVEDERRVILEYQQALNVWEADMIKEIRAELRDGIIEHATSQVHEGEIHFAGSDNQLIGFATMTGHMEVDYWFRQRRKLSDRSCELWIRAMREEADAFQQRYKDERSN